ncbi:PREDICTED: uncharacterized protein LOC109150200 [Ipomoea nil]|uniref:uncharacterized protein LOC109150200 n=1 Tax=Ipomoea nil TaxID=35883 RepID=UPI0009018B92|nr:PREDICTED: uncharacterized protein LOC109150200 [Ipomoea nil]
MSRPQQQRGPNPKYFNDKIVNVAIVHPIASSIEPKTVSQALKKELWTTAMTDEFNSLVRNKTWELVPRCSHVVVDCKWVFRVKRKADCSVDRFKARLVTKGFLQESGRDYFEMFSPVVKPVTIQVILKRSIWNNWLVLLINSCLVMSVS